MKLQKYAVVLAAMMLPAGAVRAEVTIDMVTVGDAGNTTTMVVDNGDSFWWPNPSAGAVADAYLIAKTEVNAGQYVEFLNVNIATVDTYELYSSQMANADGCGISLSGGVYVAADANVAVNYVSWGQAARFANWMHNGQVAGATETGAYTINGAITDPDLALVALAGRDAGAFFFLPSLDEWVKAAYYDALTDTYYAYPTTSDTAPTAELPVGGANSANLSDVATAPIGVGLYTGTTSPYGAFDMAGNVNEYIETTVTLYGEGISMLMGNAWTPPLGGKPYAWVHTNHDQQNDRRTGFRVAAPRPPPGPGDFNEDYVVDALDIDILCDNMGGLPATYDLNDDSVVDEGDLVYLVTVILGTYMGDFNLDGVVNATDLGTMSTNFGLTGFGWAGGNANCDDVINATDLGTLSTNFGLGGGGNPIPEPATLSLLALGACLPLFRRKRR